MANILALDEGTTSARAIVFDTSRDGGAIVALAQREIALAQPEPGWVEQDPEELARTQIELACEVLDAVGLAPRDVTAIGITNQRETTIVWDRATSKPIYPAIVWQDRRTAGACERLRARGVEPRVQQRTGLLLDPYFSATKLAGILDLVPGARARAERGELAFGTVDTWLVWNLTNGARHVTDASNASRTLLFDLARGDWDEDMLALFRVPRAVLPDIVDTSAILGECATSTGLGGIPIAAIVGDQQAALFGQMCTTLGATKCTYGTGCFLLQNTGTERVVSTNRLLSTVAWRVAGATAFALEGSVFVGGALVQWLRDGLGLIRASADIESLAASVADCGDVVIVPAFAGLGAPHWDPRARGTILGLTRGTTRAHIARAALESIALQVVDLTDALRADVGVPLGELRVDGGASKNDLLMQMQADFLQAPVMRAANAESTALGAAFLAGLATGVWKDARAIESQRKSERVFEPRMPRAEVAKKRARWQAAVERSKGWA